MAVFIGVLGSCGGAARVEAPGEPPVLPPSEPCVDPMMDAESRRTRFNSEGKLPETPYDAALVDLDGDGHKDPFITTEEGCGTGGCVYYVYRGRAGCGVYVGQIEGKGLKTSSGRSHGLSDLEFTWWLGCCARVEQRARFDGHRYRVEGRECSLAVETDVWTCQDWRTAGDLPP